jgi:hypothetical protein
MRPVLVIPAGHVPDWTAAKRHVEAMSPETLRDLVDDAARIMGQFWIDEEIVWQRLRDGLAELRSALRHAGDAPNGLHCTLRVIGEASVLFEPHPFGRPTFLFVLIRLLDRAGVLDPLGVESLCEIDKPATDDDTEGVS